MPAGETAIARVAPETSTSPAASGLPASPTSIAVTLTSVPLTTYTRCPEGAAASAYGPAATGSGTWCCPSLSSTRTLLPERSATQTWSWASPATTAHGVPPSATVRSAFGASTAVRSATVSVPAPWSTTYARVPSVLTATARGLTPVGTVRTGSGRSGVPMPATVRASAPQPTTRT